MLNLIFLSPHSDPEAELGEPDAGGQCVYEHQLAKSLVTHYDDIRITTFCRQTGNRSAESNVHDRYTIKRLIAGHEGFLPKEAFESILPEFVTAMNKHVKGQKNMLLHSHYWDGGKAALLLKSMQSAYLPLIWTPHSLGALKRGNFRTIENETMYNFIPRMVWENYTTHAANQIIISSEREKQVLRDHYALEENKASVVPPGVDVQHFSPINKQEARKQLGLSQSPLILLCVGRMEPTKGFHHALESVDVFRQIYSLPFELHIYAGKSSVSTPTQRMYAARLRQQIKDLDLVKQVILHDALPHDRVNVAYAAADIFMMLSDNEPYGFTLLEAMATQTAPIASNTGGASSVITQNRNGILVQVQKPAIIATYLRSLALDVEYRESIARNARRTIMEAFSWNTQVEKFREIYDSVMSQPEQFPYEQWVGDSYFLSRAL